MTDGRGPTSRHRSGRAEPAVATAPPGRPAGVAAPLASLLLPLAALLVVQSVSPAAQRLPVGPARFELAASWLAAAPGALAGSASWLASPLLGRLQLGLLMRAVPGGQSVLASAQTALLLLAAVQTVLVWCLLRRTGRGAVAAGLAAAAFSIAPAAVLAHTTVSTASVALVWLLLAGLLVTVRSRPAGAAAGACAVLAVAAQPLTLIPVLAGAVALATASRRPALRRAGGDPRPRARSVAIGAAGAAAAVVLAGAVLLALPASAASRALDAVTASQGLQSSGAAALGAAVRTDPLGVVVAAVALGVVARRRGGRLLGVTAAVIGLASVWPAGADVGAPVAVVLPVVAIAVAVVADRAVVELASPVLRRSLIGSGWLTGVAALLLVSVVVTLTGLEALVAAQDRPVARTARWLAGSVPRGQVVLVGLGAWPDLARAGSARVGWYAAGGSGPVPSSTPWTRADYVVADPALGAAAGTAGAVLSRSVVVARFGSGAGELAVRAVRGASGGSSSSGGSASPDPTATPGASATPSSAAERRSAAERLRAGRELSGNARIELSGDDRALLRSGRVDTRIALVLAQLATTHRVTVRAFGSAPGDASGIRTTVLISRLDGSPVPGDVTTTGELLRFLSALRGDFATRSIDSSEDGVTAGFTPDATFVPAS